MVTLQSIRLLKKSVPCGEAENSKKGIYEITDNFYKFWYRYVFSDRSYHAILGKEKTCDEILGELNDYMGSVFEKICVQHLILASRAFPLAEEQYFIFISKSGFTNPVLRRAEEDGAMLFTLEDLFA